ncbi:hypothetical protein [uncultured Nocardioides sp.]|nr:hypothetical protein [uncultured Nocardioides sp.]
MKMLDEDDGSLPSDEVARRLAAEGVDSTAKSTAVAYAVQRGDVDVD